MHLTAGAASIFPTETLPSLFFSGPTVAAATEHINACTVEGYETTQECLSFNELRIQQDESWLCNLNQQREHENGLLVLKWCIFDSQRRAYKGSEGRQPKPQRTPSLQPEVHHSGTVIQKEITYSHNQPN